jgi:uncharacterized glyoxalase superfamily protein PhnB
MSAPGAASGSERAQPESFRARALNVSLTVKDLAASTGWYRDVVGFTVERTYEREGRTVGTALVAGDVRMLLNQDNGARGLDRVKGEGFSMQIVTTQSIDAIAARIREKGGTLESEPADMPWGARIFRLTDPDGYRIAISSERPGGA